MESRQDRRKFMTQTAAAGGAIAFGGLTRQAHAQNDLGDSQDLNFFDVVRRRRSVRKFKPDPVPEEHLRQILDATRLAPTSGNQQPWKFLIVKDRVLLDRLKDTCVEQSLAARRARSGELTSEQTASVSQYYLDYLSAPVYVVVLTDNESRYPTYNHWDGPLAAGYLMLAARALGYGTVFCTDSIPEEITRQVFEIPDRYTRVCITPIGVPEAWPDSPEKKSLDEFIMTTQ
ncbi:nitroreductase family protein [Gemmatimonadota bacterium]